MGLTNLTLLRQAVQQLQASGGGSPSLITVTNGDASSIAAALATAVSEGKDGILLVGDSYVDCEGRDDDGFVVEVPLELTVQGAPGNTVNIINATQGAGQFSVDAFRTARATLGRATPLTVFRGLNFVGDNGTDEATFTAQYNNQGAFVGSNNSSTFNVLVEDCTFKFGWGFSLHGRNDDNENFSSRNCTFYCMANGVNCNESWSSHTDSYHLLCEGYECSGGHIVIARNHLRETLGAAITIGGNQSGSWFEGSEVTENTISICTAGAAITVTDGVRGAIIANNKASRADWGALIFHGAVTPPERCNIAGNLFFDNCKNPGANLVGMDFRDSSVGGHSITGNQCYDSGAAGFGQEFAMSLAVPNCKVFGNYFKSTAIDVQYSDGATNTSESGNTYGNNTQQWLGTSARSADVITAKAASDYVFQTRLYNLSSVNARAAFSLRGDGMLEWGDNLNLLDTNLYRSAADTLKTDDTFIAGTALKISTGAAQTVGVAAPVAGAHVLGEIVWNTSPTSGGFIGWVCTSAGTPGTWKTFGVIS